jgi:hypothetical protein
MEKKEFKIWKNRGFIQKELSDETNNLIVCPEINQEEKENGQ